MKILTNNNTSYELNSIPTEKIDDTLFCIIDYTDYKNVDYMFIPLLHLETFSKRAVEISIGGYKLLMPLDWHIMIGDKYTGDLELLALSKINDRNFQAFVFNPLQGYIPDFFDISINEVYGEVRWYFPKLKYAHILSIPLESGNNPKCAYFVKDLNKLPDVLDITQLV